MIILASCDYASDLDNSNRLVVEGYIYTGQNEQTIWVSELVPLLATEESYAVNNAEVVVTGSDNSEFIFELDEEEEGKYVHGDFEVLEGLTYLLDVSFEDLRVSGMTVVPVQPQGLSATDNRMIVPQVTDLSDRELVTMDIYWDNAVNSPYLLNVENLQNEGSIVYFDGPFSPPEELFAFTAEPTTSDTYTLQSLDLQDYGPHQVVLYAINQEYVDLYNTFGEDSRSFSEPLTNVVDGLGIFTAVSSDTLLIDIVKP